VKLLKLVKWYLGFFHVWAFSLAFFFAYVFTYDRFAILTVSPSWDSLVNSAWSLQEPVLMAAHTALVAAVLFSFEEGEGYSYLRHLTGAGRLQVFAAKWLAYLLLTALPLAAARSLLAASWDYRMLAHPGFAQALAKLLAGAALQTSYLFPFYAFWALASKRATYFVVGAFLELYLLESFWGGPLLVYRSHLMLLRLPFNPALGWLARDLGARIAASLAHLVAAAYLEARGEVKWR
jgi:hypothetical protein